MKVECMRLMDKMMSFGYNKLSACLLTYTQRDKMLYHHKRQPPYAKTHTNSHTEFKFFITSKTPTT